NFSCRKQGFSKNTVPKSGAAFLLRPTTLYAWHDRCSGSHFLHRRTTDHKRTTGGHHTFSVAYQIGGDQQVTAFGVGKTHHGGHDEPNPLLRFGEVGPGAFLGDQRNALRYSRHTGDPHAYGFDPSRNVRTRPALDDT